MSRTRHTCCPYPTAAIFQITWQLQNREKTSTRLVRGCSCLLTLYKRVLNTGTRSIRPADAMLQYCITLQYVYESTRELTVYLYYPLPSPTLTSLATLVNVTYISRWMPPNKFSSYQALASSRIFMARLSDNSKSIFTSYRICEMSILLYLSESLSLVTS